MVIEDDQTVRELICELLEMAGLTVEFARDGREGVRKGRKVDYDLILLDIFLPFADGEKVLKIFKRFSHTERLPIIVISGNLTKDLLIRLKEQGVRGFLAKPFDSSAFYDVVGSICPVEVNFD